MNADLAKTTYQASLESFTKLRSPWGRALCLVGLTDLERQAGHLEEAYRSGYQALEIYSQMGDRRRLIPIRFTLGEIAEQLGSLDDARNHFEANLNYFRQFGDGQMQQFYLERLNSLEIAGP